MRPLIVLAALAWSPAFAASPPLCALPAPGAIPVADRHAEATTSAQSTEAAPLPTPLARFREPSLRCRSCSMWPRPVPWLRISVSRTGCVRSRPASGDQFMLFQVTPDGQAAISGAPVELTPAQLETIASGNIPISASSTGCQGYFVRSGPQFQVFYATPDNERLIPGVMWDAAGKDLTRAAGRAHSRRDPNRGGRRHGARTVELRRS